MIYTPNDYLIPDFDTKSDAFSWFEQNCNYKYDILWCNIAGKTSCVIGSSMAEDYAYVSAIGELIENFLTAGNVADATDTATELTSEVRDFIYDKLERWGVADIYYFTDTF